MATPETNSAEEFRYIHGFSDDEQQRLLKQSLIAEPLIYRDVDFSGQQHILEVGSGVGAQTEILLRRFPRLRVTGIDLNDRQLESGKQRLGNMPWLEGRWESRRMDATRMDFDAASFDGAFLCWVLEHVPQPSRVLSEVRRVLRPGSPVYITEVMNSSFFLDPYSPAIWKYWMAFNDYQYEVGGDPFIGAKLGNLLLAGGFRQVETHIKTFHFDNRQPARRQAMIAFWEELLLSAADQLIEAGCVTRNEVEDMHAEFQQVQSDPDAVFFYSFVQATAMVI